jgi:hypothetical protein
MKKMAVSLMVVLLAMVCDVPALSVESESEYKMYKEYRDTLYELQEDMAVLYLEVNQGKNLQAVYQHVLIALEKTASTIGEAEYASKDMHEQLQIKLQNYMELFFILGLLEKDKKCLIDAGYTEEDIDGILEWILQYNDYYHHAQTGFTAQERERFTSLGLTDEDISELQSYMVDHYAKVNTAQEMLEHHKTELLNIQLSLSVGALQILKEIEHGNGNGKGNSKGNDNKNLNRLLNAENALVEAIQYISKDQSSLEHVKAYSKQVYKAVETLIKQGEHQYAADFFVGLQIHCAAITALSGDAECGLAEICLYKEALSECAQSAERPSPSVNTTTTSSTYAEPTLLEREFVGRVEELDETNNMGVTHVFVKGKDTTFLQFIVMFATFVSINFAGEVSWSVTLPQLTGALGSLPAAGVLLNPITLGVGGGVLLLIVTAPSVGFEWPPAVPGWIEGDEVIVIVEGSYGQGHIEERAEWNNKCIASSHQAILDDKYMIRNIIKWGSKLFYNQNSGQYIFYYVDEIGKEWCVFVEEYENDYYQLITAYRVDCPSPYRCRTDGNDYPTIIEKWICEGFKLISFW